MGGSLDRLRVIVAWLITGAWLATMAYSAFDRTYSPPAEVQILMTAVAALLFGPKITGRGDKE